MAKSNIPQGEKQNISPAAEDVMACITAMTVVTLGPLDDDCHPMDFFTPELGNV